MNTTEKEPLSSLSAVTPTEKDVLLGKGTPINQHPGNKAFRERIKHFHEEYDNEPEGRKYVVAKKIVDSFLANGTRFLKKDSEGVWEEVPKKRAYGKAQQTLRDGAPKRREMKAAAVRNGLRDRTNAAPTLGKSKQFIPMVTVSKVQGTTTEATQQQPRFAPISKGDCKGGHTASLFQTNNSNSATSLFPTKSSPVPDLFQTRSSPGANLFPTQTDRKATAAPVFSLFGTDLCPRPHPSSPSTVLDFDRSDPFLSGRSFASMDLFDNDFVATFDYLMDGEPLVVDEV